MMSRRNSWLKYKAEDGSSYYFDVDTYVSQWDRPVDYNSDDDSIPITTNDVIVSLNSNSETPEYYANTQYYFDYSNDLVNEMMLYLDNVICFDSTRIVSGSWSDLSNLHLEILDYCLKNLGTNMDWKIIFTSKNSALITYLLKFMDERVDWKLCDLACSCFAYGFMMNSSVWSEYSEIHDTSSTIANILHLAIKRIKSLLDTPPDELNNGDPYLGFDERDVHDFNTQGREQTNANISGGANDNKAKADIMVSTWLLLLFQILLPVNMKLNGLVRSYRVAKLATSQVSNPLDDNSVNNKTNNIAVSTIDSLLYSLKLLLQTFHLMKEDSYLLGIKVVAVMNHQMPERYLVGSTEVAELCASCQFNATEVKNVNISEGLMHLLNDIGYPEYEAPETLAALQLCIDLISVPDYGGFFYVNDTKILVDVVIRELTNIPRIGIVGLDKSSLEETTRQIYLKLARTLKIKSCWETIDGYYRKSDLDEILTSLLDFYAEDEGSAVRDMISDILDN